VIDRDDENIRAMTEDRSELREDPYTYRPLGGSPDFTGIYYECFRCGREQEWNSNYAYGSPVCCGGPMVAQRRER